MTLKRGRESDERYNESESMSVENYKKIKAEENPKHQCRCL
jgi:hypothetical protein